MALARCKECGPPKGQADVYMHRHTPVGFPTRAVLCGSSDCNTPALIWLTASEQKRYLRGERLFRYSSHSPAMELQ
jgi:hypothetical protein